MRPSLQDLLGGPTNPPVWTLENYLAFYGGRVKPEYLDHSQVRLLVDADIDGLHVSSKHLSPKEITETGGQALFQELVDPKSWDGGDYFESMLLLKPKLHFHGGLSGHARTLKAELGSVNGNPLWIRFQLVPYSTTRQQAIHELGFLLGSSGVFETLVTELLQSVPLDEVHLFHRSVS